MAEVLGVTKFSGTQSSEATTIVPVHQSAMGNSAAESMWI